MYSENITVKQVTFTNPPQLNLKKINSLEYLSKLENSWSNESLEKIEEYKKSYHDRVN